MPKIGRSMWLNLLRLWNIYGRLTIIIRIWRCCRHSIRHQLDGKFVVTVNLCSIWFIVFLNGLTDWIGTTRNKLMKDWKSIVLWSIRVQVFELIDRLWPKQVLPVFHTCMLGLLLHFDFSTNIYIFFNHLFSGLVLQDLTFVHIGNPNMLNDNNINFSKRWQQYNIVVNMKRFKKWWVINLLIINSFTQKTIFGNKHVDYSAYLWCI